MAKLVGGATRAGKGVRSLCCARRGAGGACMETEYVSFDRPQVAAIKMTRGPIYIGAFAASLRQASLPGGLTRVSYKFRVGGRPAWLAPVLDPLLAAALERETTGRLAALKAFLER